MECNESKQNLHWLYYNGTSSITLLFSDHEDYTLPARPLWRLLGRHPGEEYYTVEGDVGNGDDGGPRGDQSCTSLLPLTRWQHYVQGGGPWAHHRRRQKIIANQEFWK